MALLALYKADFGRFLCAMAMSDTEKAMELLKTGRERVKSARKSEAFKMARRPRRRPKKPLHSAALHCHPLPPLPPNGNAGQVARDASAAEKPHGGLVLRKARPGNS